MADAETPQILVPYGLIPNVASLTPGLLVVDATGASITASDIKVKTYIKLLTEHLPVTLVPAPGHEGSLNQRLLSERRTYDAARSQAIDESELALKVLYTGSGLSTWVAAAADFTLKLTSIDHSGLRVVAYKSRGWLPRPAARFAVDDKFVVSSLVPSLDFRFLPPLD